MNNYELFQSFSGQLVFDIKTCSKIRHDKRWIEHKSMVCYDIWLITDGNLNILIDDEEIFLEKGDGFLFYPDKSYAASCGNKGSCEFIFLHFDISLEKNIRPLEDFNFYGEVKAVDIKNEYSLFSSVFNEFEKKNLVSSLSLKGSLILLFSKMTYILSQKNRAVNNEKSPYLKLERAISYINNNIDRDVTIKTIAENLYLTEKYFITFFKKHMGITPFVYISSLKLRRAMVYLKQGEYSIKEIAYLLGYSDQYTFSKAFKRYYGFSPSNVIYSSFTKVK